MATREYIKPVFHCCWHNLFEWQGYIRQFSFQIISSARLATLALAIHDCRRRKRGKMIKMFTATDHTVRLGYQKVKSLGGGRKEPRDPREPSEPTEPREPREPREPEEPREPREPEEPQESREPREPRKPREPREPENYREPHNYRDSVLYLCEVR